MPRTAIHHLVLIAGFLFVTFPPLLPAGEPGCLLVKQFILIDSIMAGSLRQIDPVKDDSVRLFPLYRDILQQHTGFYAFVVADDRGQLKQRISFEELGSEFSGDISRAQWYRKTRKSHTSYFGGLVRVNGRFCCIWSKPCMQRNALGFKSCRGVVTALVNVGECLKLFSEEFDRPFELAHGRTVFFHSDDWREGVPYLEEPVQLADELTLTLRYPPAAEGTGLVAAAHASRGMNSCASLPVQSNQNALLDDDFTQVAVSPAFLILLFSLFFAVVAFALGVKRLPAFLYWVRKQFARLRPKHRKAEPNDDLFTVKRKVMSELYGEARTRIEKYEITKIENDVRERLRHDLREQCRCEITAELRETVRASILEEERRMLREKIQEELHANELHSLRNEARTLVRDRLQKEIEDHETKLIRKEVMINNMIRVSSPVEALAIFDEHQTGPHLTVSTTSGVSDIPCQTLKPGNVEIIPIQQTDKDE
jgi:hypothetical protein